VNEGRKDDAGKAPWHLLPYRAVASVVDVLAFGASKYGPNTWQAVSHGRDRYFAATQRHLTAWWDGEYADPESGLPHLAHAACSVLFLLALEANEGPELTLRRRVAHLERSLLAAEHERDALKAILESAK
jgi:hypothetical protein